MEPTKAEAARLLGCDAKGVAQLLQKYFYDCFGFDCNKVCPDKFTSRGWEAFEAFYQDTNLEGQAAKARARREWLDFEGWELDGKPVKARQHFADLFPIRQSQSEDGVHPVSAIVLSPEDCPDTSGLYARATALARQNPLNNLSLDGVDLSLRAGSSLNDAIQASAIAFGVQVRDEAARAIVERGIQGLQLGQALGKTALENLVAEAAEVGLARQSREGK